MFDEPLPPEDVLRINRAQLALLLHKLPSEIDQAAYMDIMDMLEVHGANQELEARRHR